MLITADTSPTIDNIYEEALISQGYQIADITALHISGLLPFPRFRSTLADARGNGMILPCCYCILTDIPNIEESIMIEIKKNETYSLRLIYDFTALFFLDIKI